MQRNSYTLGVSLSLSHCHSLSILFSKIIFYKPIVKTFSQIIFNFIELSIWLTYEEDQIIDPHSPEREHISLQNRFFCQPVYLSIYNVLYKSVCQPSLDLTVWCYICLSTFKQF